MNEFANWAVCPEINIVAAGAHQMWLNSEELTMKFQVREARDAAAELLLDQWDGTNWYWDLNMCAEDELTIYRVAPVFGKVILDADYYQQDDRKRIVQVRGFGTIEMYHDVGPYPKGDETWQVALVTPYPRQHQMKHDSMITAVIELLPALEQALHVDHDSLLVEMLYADAFKLDFC